MKYDVIIVGAGASGLMAAITAARQGSSVLVLEQKDKAGKKILATGNGRCNYTNMVQTPECYRSDDSAFAMKVLSCFDAIKTLQFFEELGIYPKNRDSYMYPNSDQAQSVVQVLLMECERLKVKLRYNEVVKEIKKPYFTVLTEKIPSEDNKNTKKVATSYETYQGSKLILAAGGCASPRLGSDGSGFKLASALGHSIIKPLPALVQLKSPDKFCKTISGVRTQARVKVLQGGRELVKEEGEVLFTDYGISGIPVLQISRFAAKALDQGKKVSLMLDFMPEVSIEELFEHLNKRLQYNPNKTMEELLVGLFNHKLSYIIIKEAKLDPLKQGKHINKDELNRLLHGIKEFRMNISDTNSFDNAQVTAGGVTTKEINASSMESKLIKNLFLVGELVDVDGTCGGYNLQWAWSSGYLSGLSAGSK